MTVTVNIYDETGRTVVYDEFPDLSRFYLGTIDVGGRYSSFGGARPKGKGFIKSIRKYAQEWAQEQDLEEFFRELHEMLIEESIKAENI